MVSSDPTENSKFKRRHVIQSVGAALGGTVIASGSSTAQSRENELEGPPAAQEKVTRLKGRELEKYVIEGLVARDVREIMPEEKIEQFQSREIIHGREGEAVVTNKPDDLGTLNTTEMVERTQNSGDSHIRTFAAKDRLVDGGEVIRVCYILEDSLLSYATYKNSQSKRKSQAKLWSVDGESVEEATIRVESMSINGETTDPSSEVTPESCPGCASTEMRYGSRNCVSASVSCVVAACGGCYWVCKGGPKPCAGCGIVVCGSGIHHCCTWEGSCSPCAMP